VTDINVVPAISAQKIDKRFPLDKASLIGCGVTTGVGAAINTAKVTPGSSVVVFGAGGIGLSIIQGARIAGAEFVAATRVKVSVAAVVYEFGEQVDALLARLERTLHLVVASLIAIGVAFIFCSGPLFSGTIAAPLPARIAISVAAIFPLAFTMGMLFPIGIRLIAKESGDLVPWAWATNGCFSVLGIFGARIIALFMGFSRALMLGLVAYALVSASVSIHSRISAKR